MLCKHEVIGSIPIGSTMAFRSACGRQDAPGARLGNEMPRARQRLPGSIDPSEIGSVAQVVRAHA